MELLVEIGRGDDVVFRRLAHQIDDVSTNSSAFAVQFGHRESGLP